MAEPIVAITTLPSRESAMELARTMLARRLCACAQVSGPIHSSYWWEGKIEVDEEWQLKLKAPADLADSLMEEMAKAHPYQVPQILILPVQKAWPPYNSWLEKECSGEGGATQ